MPELIKQLLKNLNFSEKEIQIYLALLEMGQAKAKEICRKTDLNRVTTYDILEQLLTKGLISKYKKRGVTYFNALEPDRLINYLERERDEYNTMIDNQEEKVKELLPQLISMQNIKTSKPKVQFFEGEKGMREAYEDTLASKGTILAYANVDEVHKGRHSYFPEYYKRRSAKDIFIRAVFMKSEMATELVSHNQEEKRDTRYMPEGVDFTPEINLYNNKMLVASWREKMAVIIESKEMVDLQKIIFEMVWATLPRH